MATIRAPIGVYVGNADATPSGAYPGFDAQWDGFVAAMGRSPTHNICYMDQSFAATDPSSGWATSPAYLSGILKADSRTSNIIPVYGWTMGTGPDGNLFDAISSGSLDTTIQNTVGAWKTGGFSTLYIRPAWEFNLPNHYEVTTANLSSWISAWQHLYTVIKNYAASNAMNVKIIWNPAVGGSQVVGGTTLTVAQQYPGDAYVDVYGIDIYGAPIDGGHDPRATTTDPTQYLVTTMIDMAIASGKPICFPEVGGVDLAFANNMVQALTSRRSVDIEFFCFWDLTDQSGALSWSNSSDGQAAIIAAWKKGFGPSATVVNTIASVQPGSRLWYQNPGQDGSFWVQPFKTTAQWTTSGAAVTMLRNGNFSVPTGNINVKGNYAVPWVIGVASDPLVQVTNGTKTINVRIPLGTIVEQPASVNDQSIGGVDSTQAYLCWAISGATINTGSVQASGSVITGTYGMSISDGAGPLMMDAVTATNGITQNDNAFGQLQDYELSLANADSTYVIQHMLAISLDPTQVSKAGPIWPTNGIDTSFPNPGLLPQGQTYGIPAGAVRPTGMTRGFYLLFDNAQQFGWLYYNVAGAGCLTVQAYSSLASNAALIADLQNSIGAVMGYLCILNNQTGVASQKGMAPGGVDAFPAPARLNLSPTGGVAVAPSTFGAWYPSGYNVIPTPFAPPQSLAVTTPTQQNANASFAVTGTISGYSTAPTLNYRDDAGTFGSLPAGFSVSSTKFTFANPGLATGSHTVVIRDANNTAVVVSTGTFSVVTPIVPIITPIAPSMPVPGKSFTFSGTLANYASAPTLTLADDGAVAASVPTGTAITTTAFSLLHPALTLGSHTSVISDGTNSGSVGFNVTAISGGASPNRTVITPNTGSFTDLAGNRWTVTAAGQVALNGVVDATTSNVVQMAWVNGVIWQENASLNWFSKANASAAWSAATTTSPLATSPTITIAVISSKTPGTAFQVTGSLINYGTLAPTLTYSDNSGPATAFPAGSTVTTTTFSFLHPGMPNGTQSLQVSDGGFSNTVSYSVAAAGWTSLPSTTLLINTIPGLTAATPYDIQIYATNAIGQGPTSAILTLSTVAGLPATPTGFTAAAPSNTSVALSWTASASGTAPFTYHILQSPHNAGTFVDVGTSATTAFIATGLTAATAYDFEILAVNTAGSSPTSVILTVTTTPLAATIPGAVTGLAAGPPTSTGVTLTWTAPTTGTTPFTYNVMQSPGSANTFVSVGTSSAVTFSVISLTASTAYNFRIFASNAAGNGGNSTTIAVTTSAPASALPTAPIALSASNITSTTVALAWQPPASTASAPAHIVVAIEENRGYGDIIGSASAPYINSLRAQGTLYTNYFAITHPSQPNYLALYAGSTFGYTTDGNTTALADPTLYTTLVAAGKTFKGYVDTTAGARADHAPWSNFPEAASVSTGFTSFPAAFPSGSYQNLPTVSFVIPTDANNMHDGTIATGDTWLQTNLDAYIQWAKTNNSLFVLIWDEDLNNGVENNNVACLIVGQNVPAGAGDGTLFNHYSLLRMIEAQYNLPNIRSENTATAISPLTATTSTPISYQVQYKRSTTSVWTNFGTVVTPAQTLVASAGGSITDAASNVWTITGGGQAAVNGTTDTTTANVVMLVYSGGLMWQKNTAGNWWSKTSPSANWIGGTTTGPALGLAQTITGLAVSSTYNFRVYASNAAGAGPASSPAITATTGAASSGAFGIANAQIIAPNGTTFFAKGVNIYDYLLQAAVSNAQGGILVTRFPHINMIRVPCYSYGPPSSYEPAVSRLTALGVVVLLENHQSSDGQNRGGGTGVVFTGTMLQTESDWFAALATAYINNPYVWFGTNNEPPNSYTVGVVVDQGSLTSWQVTTYNAIRKTGNKNPILLQEFGGGLTFAMGKDNTQGLWPSSSYAGMTNVFWDVHQYDWVSNYSTDVATILSTMNTMVAQAQETLSADGKCPCIIGEYGPASNGTSLDAGGYQMLTAVHQSAFGSLAWAWATGGSPDDLTDGNNNLTSPYGTTVAAFIG